MPACTCMTNHRPEHGNGWRQQRLETETAMAGDSQQHAGDEASDSNSTATGNEASKGAKTQHQRR